MTNKLSHHIKKDSFDVITLENTYKSNQDIFSKNIELMFKSISVNNIESFIWLVNKINWTESYESIISKLVSKDSFINEFNILIKTNPSIFQEQKKQQKIIKIMLSGFGWTCSDQNKKERLVAIKTIFDNGFRIHDPFFFEEFAIRPELHYILIASLKDGYQPFHKDNLFVKFCQKGHPGHIELFKKIGCDIHYMNDLPLIKAAEHNNELMVIHLIEKEGADPFSGNNFPIFTLLNVEEEEKNSRKVSSDLIVFFAKIIKNKKEFTDSIKTQLLNNNQLLTALNYLDMLDNFQSDSKSLIKSKNKKI